MFILFTNRQKYDFVNNVIDSYKSVFNACGRNMSVSQELEQRRKLYKLLKVKRKNNLSW